MLNIQRIILLVRRYVELLDSFQNQDCFLLFTWVGLQQQQMKILRFFNNRIAYGIPQFKNLNAEHLPNALISQYLNSVFYTPRYQKIPFTNEYLKYLCFLRRKKYIEQSDLYEFVENTLVEFYELMKEDRPELTINMEQKAKIPMSKVCKYHGQVDWLYSANGINPTPIIFCNKKLNPISGISAAYSNLYIRKSLEQSVKNNKNKITSGYSIITTGHQWQLIKIDQNFKLKKSVVLQGQKKLRNIYDDEKIIQVVLGMLQFCMDIPRQNVEVLEKAYEYIDQRKYMIQAQTKQEAEKSSLFSRLLTKYQKNKK